MLKRSLHPTSSRVIFLLALLLCGLAAFAAKHLQLPPQYAHWLNEEVNYIITDEERSNFLSLASDQARDAFIENFWKIRNPDPNSPTNTLEEEHYRRLAYANANFGPRNLNDGWRTDRGMVYITLGAPQQRRPYLNTKYLQQMEIWFYQDPQRVLEPFFYVVFFKPSPAEDFRLYSPYQDRPEKLIASTNAVHDDAAAIRIIQNDLGNEIANISLSLIPNEPVDLKNPAASLESDVLLNRIRNYRNLPENKELLTERRALLEGVTHRVLLGQEFSDLSVLATRDSANQASIHYLFRLLNPRDFAVGKDASGRLFYALTVDSQLLDPNGKEIYKDSRDLRDYLTSSQVEQLREKAFAIEGRLPAVPGKYQLRLEVTNLVTKQTFTQTHGVLVPDSDHSLGMSQVVFAAVAAPGRDPAQIQPFSFSGIHLPVVGADNLALFAGDPLRIIYQVWEKPGIPADLKGKSLEVSYLIGQLGVTDKQEQKQTIDRGSFDSQGNLLMGTDLPTTGLRPGNYRLVIHVSDPESNETTSQAINFRLVGGDRPAVWSVTNPSYTNAADSTLNLYRRGLCALAQQQPESAVGFLKSAVATSEPDSAMYSALAKAYRLAGDNSAALATEKQRDVMFARQAAGSSKN